MIPPLTAREKQDILFVAAATGCVKYQNHSETLLILTEEITENKKVTDVVLFMYDRKSRKLPEAANDLRVAMTDMRRKFPWLYPQQKYLRRSGE
jgi:hypothetical protein